MKTLFVCALEGIVVDLVVLQGQRVALLDVVDLVKVIGSFLYKDTDYKMKENIKRSYYERFIEIYLVRTESNYQIEWRRMEGLIKSGSSYS